MPVEQGLPWHPVATGLAGQVIPFIVAASHAHALPSAPFWFPVPAVPVASPALLCPSSLSAFLALVPFGVAPGFCVFVLLLPQHVGASGCPCCTPPPVPPACPPVRRGLSRARLAGHGLVATPVAGTSWRAGRNTRPCGVRGHLVEEGCLLMARSACAAFGGCRSVRTSWFPCVLLCVLLGLVPLPCVGRLCAQLLCCLRSSQFRALSFLLARSLHPIVVVGLSHLQLGGATGTGHFCTCLQIYKLTCHWCFLGLLWGECGALLLFCFLGCWGATRLRTSLRAVHASELGTHVSPPPGWSCAVTTNGLDVVSHKRAQGPRTRPW